MNKPKATLIILDGWGIAPPGPGNAVTLAETPYMDQLFALYPHNALHCYGPYVGLPEGQMGNSEVGHLNLGAGRVVYQDITRINLAIENGDFAQNPAFAAAMRAVREHGSTLHLMGLIGPGGVHALSKHLNALIAMAGGLERVAIHAFLDGRDTPPDSGKGYVEELLNVIKPYNGRVKLASLSGRYYAMDRDNRWEREEKVWQAMVLGQGIKVNDPLAALAQAYQNREFDEFIAPRVLVDDNGRPIATVKDNDAIIFFNFRSDRARELAHVFNDKVFNGFARDYAPRLSAFVTMTQYDDQLKQVLVAYPPEDVNNTLAEVLAADGLLQLHIAETEKYAHVTFFFNGGMEEPVKGEDRVLVPSPKDVSTYDQKPAMSALEVTDELLKRISSGKYDFILVNYANCDMVGHTGVLAAAIEAVETLDKCMARLIPALLAQGGKVLLTADHGNAEQMLDGNGGPYTAHTAHNLVPVLYIAQDAGQYRVREGALCDVAPTILHMIGLAVPEEMTGRSLLEKV